MPMTCAAVFNPKVWTCTATPRKTAFSELFAIGGITSPGAALCAAPQQDNRRESLGQGLLEECAGGPQAVRLGGVDRSRSLEVEARSAALRTMAMIGLASGAVAVGIEFGAVARFADLDRRPARGARLVAIGIVSPSVCTRRRAGVRQQTPRQFADTVTLHAEIKGTAADERGDGEPHRDSADRRTPLPQKAAPTELPTVLDRHRAKRPVFGHRFFPHKPAPRLPRAATKGPGIVVPLTL